MAKPRNNNPTRANFVSCFNFLNQAIAAQQTVVPDDANAAQAGTPFRTLEEVAIVWRGVEAVNGYSLWDFSRRLTGFCKANPAMTGQDIAKACGRGSRSWTCNALKAFKLHPLPPSTQEECEQIVRIFHGNATKTASANGGKGARLSADQCLARLQKEVARCIARGCTADQVRAIVESGIAPTKVAPKTGEGKGKGKAVAAVAA